MDTVKLRPLCHALGINATRIEQWMSRGYLKMDNETVPGRARQCTKNDAAHILALVDLVEAGFDAAKVWREVQYLSLFRHNEAYLIISTGYLGRLIPSSPQGSSPPTDEECTPIYTPGMLHREIVQEVDLLRVLKDRQRHVTVVINLNVIEERIEEAWRNILENS